MILHLVNNTSYYTKKNILQSLKRRQLKKGVVKTIPEKIVSIQSLL
jgi:hypothetical protein